ncbi:RNA-binding protein [Salinarchaeum sp. IM2453]|uniref:RNA-binding protein n=1 Tax=Salinarchaeum sp. IM2453 TaxID=2862870 RepID=UPI001C82A4E1|nr:RNA-binding protein [Salinarchaeum sp. IM2453]QZA87860.1 RNA-binding protein [Salinarchaeum sp. IM2453]
MGSVPLHYVDLRAFCYATEDDKGVERALRRFLPEDTHIEQHESEGHYGDRILVFSARVENADEIRHVLSQLAEGDVLDTISTEIDDRVTDNTELFIRLDKQKAFNGEVAVGEGITFRAKVEAYPAKREYALENVRELIDQYTD